MSRLRIIGIAASHAAVATAYVTFIATMLPKLAPAGKETPITGAAFLLVFCASAAVMAALVFLKPILWYLDGKKQDALVLMASIIAWLFAAAAIVLAIARVHAS